MKIDISRVNLLEKDIEDYLWENPKTVCFNGWRVAHWIKRQYSVPSGIIDLLGQTTFGWFVVVEVKNVEIDAKAIAQALRYTHDINEILFEMNGDNNLLYRHYCSALLIGPSISTNALRECEATGVHYVEFKADLMLSMSQIILSEPFREERSKSYKQLASDESLQKALADWVDNKKTADEFWAKVESGEIEIDNEEDATEGDNPNEYSDIILG